MPNQITGPNAGGPRQFSIPTPLAARVGQFWRWRKIGIGIGIGIGGMLHGIWS